MSTSPSERRPKVSVVLPAFNEEEALAEAVRTYLDVLERDGLDDFELILVNDCSGDRTGEIADRFGRQDPRIRVFHNERNLGASSSFLGGFAQARGSVITWNGVDLPFHPRDTRRMLDEIERGADVIVVERANRSAYGLKRKFVSWANVLILRLLLGSPFRDHTFVQFFRREVIERMSVVSRGVSTTTVELITRARCSGWHVQAVTAEYHRRTRGVSTVTNASIVRALWDTLELRRTLQKQRTRRTVS